MNRVGRPDLPLFDRFAEVAEDDELFEAVLSGEALSELPQGDVFVVSHPLNRDTPYGIRDHHELVYVLEGRATATVSGREVFLLADSMLVATPSTTFGLRASDEPVIVVVIGLRPQLFASGVFAEFLAQDSPVARTMRGEGSHDHMVLSDAYGRILYRSVRALLKEYAHAGHTASLSVKARVLLLVAQLSEVETYSFYGMDRRLTEVMAYLRGNCGKASVASLAARFGYSETYFSHLVREQTGVHARELIVAERLRRARELLVMSDLPVHEVSEAVGYKSYSHFNRIFHKTFHITPAAYRAFAGREIAMSES